MDYVFSSDCSLKFIDGRWHIYSRATDELYGIDREAFNFLSSNEVFNEKSLNQEEAFFIKFCKQEDFLVKAGNSDGKKLIAPQTNNLSPSLRYLLIHINENCNLRCKHCYLGDLSQNYLTVNQLVGLFKDMERVSGLVVLLSGGEPLAHPEFWLMNNTLNDFDIRFELLTNGTMITPLVARELNVQHVQVSIDGLAGAHDYMRGKGSYNRAMQGIRNLLDAGMEVSISTMVFKKNLQDFPQMLEQWQQVGISQWLVNSPSAAGSWLDHEDLSVPIDTIVEFMIEYSYTNGLHQTKFNDFCGSHICSIFSDGRIFPCPLIKDDESLLGEIIDGLENSWNNRKVHMLDLSECGDCSYIEECKGGCKFRAIESGDKCGRDPVLCAILKGEEVRKSEDL